MKLILKITFLILLIYSCNDQKETKSYQLVGKPDFTIPKDTNTLYYPLDSLDFAPDNRGSDSFIKAIYSEILFNLKEPVFYNYTGKWETIRFLWMRPFDNPIAVRMNKKKDTVCVNIKELEKKYDNNGNYIYIIKLDTILTSTNEKWQDILRSFTDNSFQNISSYDETLVNYKDITSWVLEARLENMYHCINRAYIDSLSLKKYAFAKKLFDIGNSIISMKNSRESQ